jgi:predicted  nucleic acid-binding Zn-ribbon protein
MSNLDEPDIPQTGGASEVPASNEPGGTESRMKELERENARLRAELADLRSKHKQDRELMMAYMLEGMPRTREEFDRVRAESLPFDEVLRQLEQEFGTGTQP